MKMRKITATVTALALMGTLCACNNETTENTTAAPTSANETTQETSEETTSVATEATSEETSEETTQATAGDDIASQIDLIVRSKDLWYKDEIDDYFLAVTDLDHNGRLEIIYASIQGSGGFTYADFYEVNAEMNAIVRCGLDTEYTEGFSYPDLITPLPIRTFFDGDRYYYILDDMSRLSASVYVHSFNVLSLADSIIKTDLLAMENGNEDGTCTYTDADDNEIDEEAFNNIVDTVFAGKEESECTIKWIESTEITDLNEQLTDSYMTFSGN